MIPVNENNLPDCIRTDAETPILAALNAYCVRRTHRCISIPACLRQCLLTQGQYTHCLLRCSSSCTITSIYPQYGENMKLTALSAYVQISQKLENTTMQNTALTVIARDCTGLPCTNCPLFVKDCGRYRCIDDVDRRQWQSTVQRMIGKKPA